MIVYPDDLKDPLTPWGERVNKTWIRLSGSSVYLHDQQVFMTVTRVVFYLGEKDWSVMSFIRAQIYDQNWNHLENYALAWGEKTFTFPLVFPIPVVYEAGGGFYGPEDPRIIIEAVSGAEPVIVFNMIVDLKELRRGMYIYRPFSDQLILLNITGREQGQVEKNWSPFFYHPARTSSDSIAAAQRPNDYLHFIYSFGPLRILKCDLLTGDCQFAFEQEEAKFIPSTHPDIPGTLRGGTNFAPVSLPSTISPSVSIFAGIPRTTVPDSCKEPFYRPNLAVLVNTIPPELPNATSISRNQIENTTNSISP
jgi:beta-1,2-mannosyltransferase